MTVSDGLFSSDADDPLIESRGLCEVSDGPRKVVYDRQDLEGLQIDAVPF